jgi:hypothetical protein
MGINIIYFVPVLSCVTVHEINRSGYKETLKFPQLHTNLYGFTFIFINRFLVPYVTMIFPILMKSKRIYITTDRCRGHAVA